MKPRREIAARRPCTKCRENQPLAPLNTRDPKAASSRRLKPAASSRCHSYHNQIVKDQTNRRAMQAPNCSLPDGQRSNSIPRWTSGRLYRSPPPTECVLDSPECPSPLPSAGRGSRSSPFTRVGPSPVGKSNYIEACQTGKGGSLKSY